MAVMESSAGVAAWRAMLLAHSGALREVEEEVQRAGKVPLSWYDVLLELNAAKERLRMRDLSDRVVLSRTRVSRLVDEMVRAGLVRKEVCGDDGRVFYASITEAGRTALRETAPVYLASIDRHFTAHLQEDEAAVLTRALLKVARAHGRG
jgi:DNA-binding MarR family transcriptional regulator